MFGMYHMLSRRMDNENAAKIAITLSIIGWFIIGSVIGSVFRYIFNVDFLNAVIIFGSKY